MLHGKYGRVSQLLRAMEVMEVEHNFWQGKKVLLTRHTGFKGTWMSVMLEQLGAEICGYSLPLSKYSFYYKVNPSVAQHEEGDIADTERVLSLFKTFQPEIVLHFASHSSLKGSREIPDFILRTNFMGVLNVLEAVRKTDSVRALVVVTSDKCYQNMETDVPYAEESPLWATDPYSVSKVCQELLTHCYRDTFFEETNRIGIATARASNVIGAGDYNISRLMPYLLDSFANDRIPQIRNPHAVRPWQCVLDVIYGYLLLAEKLYVNKNEDINYNGAYNFGPDKNGFAEVSQVAEMVSRCFGDLRYEIKGGGERIKKEAKILKLDSTKAEKELGWKRHRTLEDTVRFTVDFIKKEKDGCAAAELCRRQVVEYLKGVQ